jgi:hypothetical protein
VAILVSALTALVGNFSCSTVVDAVCGGWRDTEGI